MQVVDLTPKHLETYLHCLEPWSAEIVTGVPRRRAWYDQMKDKGLIVKLAIDDDGAVAGMLQSLPIEQTHMQGEGLYVVLCIWVHGHKQGVGDRQHKGMGRALLAAVEAEARERGALGMAAWGLALPMWMRASWFERQGYRRADRDGMARLVWKPFVDEARPPTWLTDPITPPSSAEGVQVTCVDAGWCTVQAANCEHARRAAKAEGADYRSIDTSDPEEARRWRQADGIYVGGKQVAKGPPLSVHKLRKLIAKQRHGGWWHRA